MHFVGFFLASILITACGSKIELVGRSSPVVLEKPLPQKNQDQEGIAPAIYKTLDIETLAHQSKTRFDNGIAIIFGIENYKYTYEATYKKNDVDVFYQLFRHVLNIPDDRILVRKDSDATKAEFDYVFEPLSSPKEGWLKKRLRDPVYASNIDIFIYLAGHGFPDFRGDFYDNKPTPYFIPYDVRPEQATNGVNMRQLYQDLSEFGARSTTVFVESCFSGATGYFHSNKEIPLVKDTNPIYRSIEQPVVGPNMVVFTATSGTKPSSNRDDLGHGIFSYYVLKGFGGAADSNRDNSITVEELYRYLAVEVPQKALEPPLDREQIPEIFPPIDRMGDRARRILVQY